MKKYLEICAATKKVVKKAADFILNEKNKVVHQDIELKQRNHLVSYVDKEAEKILVSGLKEILPQSDFLAEEGTENDKNTNDFKWIIDPLDGTTNFLHQVPPFAVSVGLMFQNEMVLGVVHEITADECFWAVKNEGAFLNDKKISVSNTKTLENALLSTGFPYYDYSILEKYIELLQFFMKNTRGIRRHGAASVDLCYVACGRFDGFFEHSLAPWDVSAGSLIVQEAGGEVTDFGGGDNFVFGREIIAWNGKMDDFYKNVNQNLG